MSVDQSPEPGEEREGYGRPEAGEPAVEGGAAAGGHARVPGAGDDVDAEAEPDRVEPVSGEHPVGVRGEVVVEVGRGAQAPGQPVLAVLR
ncbi:hypothetical protein [Streptomyces sp. NPDC052721]|uniref:hypothetical protein n=1 Tax=Streptomyces sp. NPDC052721 TaxID=3154955 RepID=UPI0034162AD9